MSSNPVPIVTTKQSRLTAFQWVIMASAAILGSIIFCEITGTPFGLADILGGSIFPFAVASIVALSLKQWRGTVLAVLFVAIFDYAACSNVVTKHSESQSSQQATR